MKPVRWTGIVCIASLCLVNLGGCPSGDDLEDIIEEAGEQINDALDNLADRNSYVLLEERIPDAELVEAGLVIEQDVTIITDFRTQVVVEDLRSDVFVAFTNDTGFDIVIEYQVDGFTDFVFVPVFESVLTQYSCFDFLDVVAEYDFDPITGGFVPPVFEYTQVFAERGYEFECGDLIEVIFSPDDVTTFVDPIDLAAPF